MNKVKNPVWEQLKEEAVKKLRNNKELLGKSRAKKWTTPSIIGERYCPNFLLYLATD